LFVFKYAVHFKKTRRYNAMTITNTVQGLEKRLKDNPKSLLFARLADLYLQEERTDEAIALCLKGLEHHSSYVTGHFVLGKAYMAKGDSERAEEQFKKVLSHDQQYLAAHKLLGDLMAKMGWENKAVMHYRNLLSMDPMDEETRQMLKQFSFEEEFPSKTTTDKLPEKKEPLPFTTHIAESAEKKNWREELEEVFNDEKRAGLSQDISHGSALAKEDDFSELEIAMPDKDQKSESEINSVSAPVAPDLHEEPFSLDFLEERGKAQKIITESEVKQEEEFFFDLGDERIGKEKPPTAPSVKEEAKEETPLLFKEEVPAEKYETDIFPDSAEKKVEETLESKVHEEKVPDQSSWVPEKARSKTEHAEPKTKKGSEEQKIVSPTLGEIYAAQGQYAKAIRVYETLLEKNPEEKRYRQKIEELQKKLKENPSK